MRKFNFHKASLSLCVALVIVTSALMLLSATKNDTLRSGESAAEDTSPKIAIAYVESQSKGILDPDRFTHLIYAFAEFNDDCDGLDIAYPERLKEMADLKKVNPQLKVMLGLGGYKRKGFCEMAGDKEKKRAYIREVKALVDSLGLDGVDLDWEFPTTEAGGHTASPDDAKNYVSLVKDLRKALGKNKWLSFFSDHSALFIDLRKMSPYVDFVNVAGYNLSIPKEGRRAYHQSPLYSSSKMGDWCISKSVQRHLDLGVPKDKLLVGIPFFGRGLDPFPSYVECKDFGKYDSGLALEWDDEAKVPYYADSNGNLLLGFDNERSIQEKMNFVRANNLPGVFVWNYGGDYPDQRLGKAIERMRK